MKLRYALAMVFIGCGVVIGVDYYSDIYDNIDVDTILNSERLTKQYTDCLLDKGHCTSDGRSLKHILPEALATLCEKCNERQQEVASKVANYLRKNKPDTWSLFLDKYDPDGKYTKDFEDFLDNE